MPDLVIEESSFRGEEEEQRFRGYDAEEQNQIQLDQVIQDQCWQPGALQQHRGQNQSAQDQCRLRPGVQVESHPEQLLRRLQPGLRLQVEPVIDTK